MTWLRSTLRSQTSYGRRPAASEFYVGGGNKRLWTKVRLGVGEDHDSVGKGSVHTRAVEQGNVETQGEGAAFVAEYGVVDAGGFEGVELRRRGRLRFGHFDKGWADVGAGYGNAHVRCLRGVTQLRGGALFFLRQVAVLSCGLA
jgi:hypothetical protein